MWRPHSVEPRQATIAEAHEPKHRQHTINGVVQRGGCGAVTNAETLPQRKKIQQQLNRHARIATDVSTIRKDLRFQFRSKLTLNLAQVLIVTGDTQIGQHQRS